MARNEENQGAKPDVGVKKGTIRIDMRHRRQGWRQGKNTEETKETKENMRTGSPEDSTRLGQEQEGSKNVAWLGQDTRFLPESTRNICDDIFFLWITKPNGDRAKGKGKTDSRGVGHRSVRTSCNGQAQAHGQGDDSHCAHDLKGNKGNGYEIVE